MGLAKSKRFQQGRKDRKHQLNQIRENKKAKILEAKRSIGGPGRFAPPLLTAVINLGEDVSSISDWFISKIVSCDESAATVTKSQNSNSENSNSVIHLSFPRFKRRFAFIIPDRNNLHAVLDATKVCDSVIFLHSTDACVDNESSRIGDDIGAKLFSAVLAQGLPADPVFVLSNKAVTEENITELSSKALKKQEFTSVKNLEKFKKNWQKVIEKQYPNVDKIYTVGSSDSRQEETESLLLLRHLSSQKRRPNSLRDHRPHLMVESASFEEVGDSAGKGTLKVEGYVRCGGGNSFLSWSVNRLVHIPGWGDFQIAKVDSKTDPHPLVGDKSRQVKKVSDETDENGMSVDPSFEIKTLATADPEFQEQLIFENEPDMMDGEQTWPTEEELNEAAMNQKQNGKRFVKVPKGMGEYQAAWIIDKEDNEDDEDEYDEDMEDDEEDQYEIEAQSQECSDDEEELDRNNFEEEEYETISISNGGTMDNYDEKQDSGCKTLAEEQEAYLKLKAAREDAMFPDEVDTPLDINARSRFARYRGLKSFRTSPWDPKENLPSEYARIFQFENFDRTKKRVFADLKKERKLPDGSLEDEISVGTYVILYVKDVPKHLYNEWITQGPSKNPLVVYNMLPHEQKMCVLNVVIKRNKSDGGFSQDDVIKSKERLIFHMGYRRFTACPIFSQHTNGNKHKYVRYWLQDDIIVMTIFAPIMFPPANVLVYKGEGGMNLVGSGSLLSADPDRIIIKRAVLSGAPFKVHKKSAVVRFMFFNREDIEWFKPVELHTKRGKRGHIKEPLGTHGHMKVMFDGSITQQDTVLLNLYKRMYPKWNYNPSVTTSDYTRVASNPNGYEASETLQLTKKKFDENAMCD